MRNVIRRSSADSNGTPRKSRLPPCTTSDPSMNESEARVTSESGDVLYHLMVGLILRKVPLRELLSELSRRFGQSGHEEKASR